MTVETDHTAKQEEKGMFGEELIWLFIFGDIATFSMFFWIFGWARNNELETFRASQEHLNVHFGSINTLILLFSSWLVVMAVRAAREKKFVSTERYLFAASAFGTLFAILKSIEYYAKVSQGLVFETDNFFVFYYLLTGLHFAHVLTGIGVLLYFALVFRSKQVSPDHFRTFESGAIFWHMVDLLWIIIFPLLYLLP